MKSITSAAAAGALTFGILAASAGPGVLAGASNSPAFGPATAPPEAPRPNQEAGKSFVYSFDADAAGQVPASFHTALTGQGAEESWHVVADPSAPSPPNVFAQTSADPTSYRFPLAVADKGSFRDVDLSVRFRPISGRVDQAAGLVWRLRDANNYYIVRANALEDNVVLYKVEGGKRSDLPVRGKGRTYGQKAEVPSGEWSTLRVVATGNLFEVYLDSEKLYEVEDATFPEAGKVGLWTKADSVTHFDDLRVVAK